MYRFSNNAVGALAADLGEEDLVLQIGVGEGTLFSPLQPYDIQDGSVQLVTLTNSTMPGLYEIVALVQGTGSGSDTFIVRRGQEETPARAWPPGTQVSARITAGTLGSMLQVWTDDSGDDKIKTTDSRININGRISAYGPCAQISGWSTLQLVRASPGRMTNFSDLNMSHESMGATRLMNAGQTAAWASGQSYPTNSIVKPTVPNGYQYLLESVGGDVYAQSSTEPAFNPEPGYDMAPVEVLEDGKVAGYWTPLEEPINVEDRVSECGLLMVTEVGFICLDYDGATTPPTVSIGTLANPTLYASALQLTKITGSNTCHRIVIPEGGDLQEYINFRVDVPADGKCVGRFYWRGQSIQTF